MNGSLFVNGLTIDWNQIDPDSYLHEIEALHGVNSISFEKPVTFFVGENGTGKSTLLEAIASAYGMNPEGGSRDFRFSTRDTHSALYEGMVLKKGYRRPKDNFFLRAESFYNVATQVEEYRDGDEPEIYYRRYGGRSLHEQSHGESFLALMQNRFQGRGFYLLDEPEAALSPQRQLTLLMGLPEAEILSFDEGTLHPIEYEETESYQVTEMFLNHREYLLKRLLDETEANDL